MIFKSNFIEVLKNKNFNYLWGSQALSIFCANLLSFSLSYKVFSVTGKSLSVSFLYLSYFLPVYLLGLFSGVVIDHLSRRKILIITNFLQAACVLLFFVIGDNFWMVYPVIFLYSSIDEFYLPAEGAFLPELIKKEHLPAANTFFNFAGYGGLFFGFVLGGPIMRVFGADSPFFILFVFLSLATIFSFLLPQDKAPKEAESLREDLFSKTKENIVENFSFIRGRPKVYFPMLIMILFETFAPMIMVNMPAFGKEMLGVDLLDLAWMLIIPTGLGAIVGALTVDRIIKRGKRRLIATGAFFAGSVLLIIYLLGEFFRMGMVTQENFLTAALLLCILLGFGASLILIPSQTLLQESTPNEIRGRVFGVQKLIIGLLSIIPVLSSATIADLIGVNTIMLISGVFVLIGAILGLFHRDGRGVSLASKIARKYS